jgi:hypothetical protein
VIPTASQPVQSEDEPAVFDVGIALHAPDVAVSEGAVHEEQIAGRSIEQGRKRVAERLVLSEVAAPSRLAARQFTCSVRSLALNSDTSIVFMAPC